MNFKDLLQKTSFNDLFQTLFKISNLFCSNYASNLLVMMIEMIFWMM